jgi:catechol 2,3-dioxygenase-like lactoylglutathione lyase family enzyme
MALISGYHHLTLSTHGAQEDDGSYTKSLGLHSSIKRTVPFDGTIPVYHLYFGAQNGDPSTIVTTFPFKKPGIYGKRGTNQSKIIQLSIPVGSAAFWVYRLNERGIAAAKTSGFGITRVALAHPCGIDHELVESPADVSDQKDRNYFKSCYVRSPGEALFEIAWSVEGGWAKDEPADAIRSTRVFPHWLEDRREEPLTGLEEASFRGFLPICARCGTAI